MKESDSDGPATRIISPKNTAMSRFEAGPAREMMSSPHLLFFTLYGFHWTGLAHPNTKPVPEAIRN